MDVARRHMAWGVCLVLVAAACGGNDDDTSTDEADCPVEGDARVFAAASLTDAFEGIAAEIGDCASITFSFGGSSALVQQINEDGAPADVLATADERTMAEVGEAGETEVFAQNRLVLAVPKGNPGGITGLDDFADGDSFIGLCAAEVPCGKLGDEWLAAAEVTPSVDTFEPDVRALLTKLEAGELDAGLVYATDVQAAGDVVEIVEVDAPEAPTTSYPITDFTDAGSGFVDFVLGAEGQAILAEHGFEP
jgi:molybdate transport system substrate-binding protein